MSRQTAVPVKSGRWAFTLIELLIVVAIIAILAAIAVPNFLEAQLRAKVGRTKSDLRTISIALESYAIDANGKYPILTGYVGTSYQSSNIDRGGIFVATCLTTPVAYLTTTDMRDPFVKVKAVGKWGETDGDDTPGNHGAESCTYHYVNVPQVRKSYSKQPADNSRPKWYLISFGPDYVKGPLTDAIVNSSYGNHGTGGAAAAWLADYATCGPTPDNSGYGFDVCNYDPTNGTISGGDVIRHP